MEQNSTKRKMSYQLINWIKMEYKRAAVMLPLLLLRSALAVCIIGSMIALLLHWTEKKEETTMKIGYVAQEDTYTRLAISYIEDLDVFEGWCKLLPVTEEEGRAQLQKEQLDALLILPENVIQEILNGTNAPAKLLMSKQSSAYHMILEELTDAGINMLSIAQGEIYTVYELFSELGLAREELQAICDEVNAYNLNLVFGREDFFKIRKISYSDVGYQSNGTALYLFSSLMVWYVFLCSSFFGTYLKHSEQEQLLVWKRLKIAPCIQMIGRSVVTASMLMVGVLPIGGLWVITGIRKNLIPKVTGQGIVCVFLSFLCVATMVQICYQMAENQRTALVIVGLFAVVQGYIGGCLFPMVLLPKAIQNLAVLMPVNYVRKAFFVFFAGEVEQVTGICIGLAVSIVLCMAFGTWIFCKKTGNVTNGDSFYCNKRCKNVKLSSTLFWIYAKRLFYRKSFWASLVIIFVLSCGIVNIEQESETVIKAAVYDKGSEWINLTDKKDGYVQFVACDSEDEVKQLVLQNDVECGYVLDENLKEEIQKGRGNHKIEVYEDSDAMLTEVINEILFEKLFSKLSMEYFFSHLQEEDKLSMVLSEKLMDGSTFSVEKEYIQTNQKEEVTETKQRSTYPIVLVAVVAIVLCGLCGILEAIEDYKKYHFFNRNWKIVVLISIGQPVLCGILLGILLFLTTKF